MRRRLNPPPGALEHEFPAFGSENGSLLSLDTDKDGRLELFFNRSDLASPLCTGYDWRPSGYATMFSHTDENQGFGNGHFRIPGSTELAEFATNELRLRDLSGLVLFRASTDLHKTAGLHEIHWDGRDEQGRAVRSGMLFYEVTADRTRRSGRMVRLGR